MQKLKISNSKFDNFADGIEMYKLRFPGFKYWDDGLLFPLYCIPANIKRFIKEVNIL